MGQPEEFVVKRDGEELVYQIIYGSGATERLAGWLDTNAIDHERVPVPSRATIRDGMLTVELYAENDDGHRYADPADDTRAARITHTVPLVVEPPDCWARREVGRGTV